MLSNLPPEGHLDDLLSHRDRLRLGEGGDGDDNGADVAKGPGGGGGRKRSWSGSGVDSTADGNRPANMAKTHRRLQLQGDPSSRVSPINATESLFPSLDSKHDRHLERSNKR